MSEFREIALTGGHAALVDASDFDWLSSYTWRTKRDSTTGNLYAMRHGPRRADGKSGHPIYMHRLILGLTHGDGKTGDHIEPSRTLDNRRNNLRVATRSQQMHNQRKRKHNSSGYKGVFLMKRTGKYIALIRLNWRQHYLGVRDTPEEAHALYVEAANRLHGEFSRT